MAEWQLLKRSREQGTLNCAPSLHANIQTHFEHDNMSGNAWIASQTLVSKCWINEIFICVWLFYVCNQVRVKLFCEYDNASGNACISSQRYNDLLRIKILDYFNVDLLYDLFVCGSICWCVHVSEHFVKMTTCQRRMPASIRNSPGMFSTSQYDTSSMLTFLYN